MVCVFVNFRVDLHERAQHVVADADSAADGPLDEGDDMGPRAVAMDDHAPLAGPRRLRCVSLTQPWATLVACGAKHVETRSWEPRGLRRGEWLAIHAARGFPAEDQFAVGRAPFAEALAAAWLARRLPMTAEYGALPRGAVIGLVRFHHAERITSTFRSTLPPTERAFGDYGLGRWAWCFDTAALPLVPVPLLGHLGLWWWEQTTERLELWPPAAKFRGDLAQALALALPAIHRTASPSRPARALPHSATRRSACAAGGTMSSPSLWSPDGERGTEE